MRLIDADELKKAIIDLSLENSSHWQVIYKIDNAQTIELDEVTELGGELAKIIKEIMPQLLEIAKNNRRLQGEWIKMQGEWVTDTAYKIYFKCSECDGHFGYPFNFCPNCGSQMLGGEKE